MKISGSDQILFDVSKRNESNDNIQNEIKFILKRLKLKGWKITINKDIITDKLIEQYQIVVLLNPNLKFNDLEFSNLKQFLENGGKILILLEEGTEQMSLININYFIEEFGISVNNDNVIRTSFYKYYNPKEVYIQDGIINRSLINHAIETNLLPQNTLTFPYLYPFGATLNIAKPSIPILSTGKTSFPACRPTCGYYENETNGRMIVLGSAHMFIDKYINKENNVVLFDLLMDFLIEPSFRPNVIDALNPEIIDLHVVPDLEILCNNPMLYLEESEELPLDYSTLFSRKIKKISNQSLAKINEAFKELQIEKRTLQVIKPHFETPLPVLQPAVYMPVFRAHTKPELELYDLDNEFASIQSKLTKLANKCNNNDLEYFIRECGLILGLNFNGGNKSDNSNICKTILHSAVSKIVNFKKINNE